MSKQYFPKKELGYVLCIETHEDGTQIETEIPYRNSAASGPNLGRKAANLARASAKHLSSGARQATDEQVEKRFAVCLRCPSHLFTFIADGQGACQHEDCGCALRAVGVKGLNKLRWAEQECPAGHWGAV